MMTFQRNVLLLFSGLIYVSLGMALVVQESYKEDGPETQGEEVNKGARPKPVGRNRQKWSL
jgi:hypothetical protein